MALRRAGATALALIAVLVACAGHRQGRVIVLGLDGLDPRAVDLLMSEGKMPSFARMRLRGAYARERSAPPLLSPVLWTTVATGTPPDQHGIAHFVATDPASGESLPVTSTLRRRKALWNIASEARRRVAVVGWWATWPAEEVNGTLVSDHACYHFLFPQGQQASPSSSRVTYPEERLARLAPLIRRPADVTAAEVAPFMRVTPEELARPFSFNDDVSHFKWALATAESYRRIGLELWRDERPDLLMVYVEAPDTVSHLFGHLFRAAPLSGELAEQQRKFGGVVEQAYLYADRIVGEYLAALDPGSTLVVLSDHGFELGALQDDPSKTRDMRRVSERFHRPEGILYLYGNRVKQGARLEGPTLLDVAPSALALLGIPAARDMPGRVLREGLRLDEAPRIASHETTRTAATAPLRDERADAGVLERLRSLGYLGEAAPAPQAERNQAALLFAAGRHREAATAYEALVRESPRDASLLASLAGVLGALGRYDEAERRLDEALRLDPLNVEARHNRGVVLERRGRRDAAVEQYRIALRFDPGYEPSRKALLRLTGSAETVLPRDEAERRASVLLDQAGQAARRGDYPAAMALVDQAEKAAPRLGLVYQYRSNVAYLMGDRAAAIRALERGLALEPANPLFRTNLARLKAGAAQ